MNCISSLEGKCRVAGSVILYPSRDRPLTLSSQDFEYPSVAPSLSYQTRSDIFNSPVSSKWPTSSVLSRILRPCKPVTSVLVTPTRRSTSGCPTSSATAVLHTSATTLCSLIWLLVWASLRRRFASRCWRRWLGVLVIHQRYVLARAHLRVTRELVANGVLLEPLDPRINIS